MSDEVAQQPDQEGLSLNELGVFFVGIITILVGGCVCMLMLVAICYKGFNLVNNSSICSAWKKKIYCYCGSEDYHSTSNERECSLQDEGISIRRHNGDMRLQLSAMRAFGIVDTSVAATMVLDDPEKSIYTNLTKDQRDRVINRILKSEVCR